MKPDCKANAFAFVDKPTLISPTVTRCAELEYLSDMLPQMRRMAVVLKEPTLAYLLELAMLEAQLQHEIELETHELQDAG